MGLVVSCGCCLVPAPPDEDKRFIPAADQDLCPGNSDIESQATIPIYDELTEESSEISQSEDEESDDKMFVYQSISQLISQRKKDLEANDETEWIRRITIGEVQNDQDSNTDEFHPQDNLRKEDGNELESTMAKFDLNPNNDDIVSLDTDQDEEEYFGDDENGPILKIKHEEDKVEDGEKEIVLNPEYLNLNAHTSTSSPGYQTPPNTPRLARKQSLRKKIFETLQKNFPTPGKNVDISPKTNKKKENIKIILF